MEIAIVILFVFACGTYQQWAQQRRRPKGLLVRLGRANGRDSSFTSVPNVHLCPLTPSFSRHGPFSKKKTSLGHNKGGGLFTLLKFVWEAVNSPPSYINLPLFFASKVKWETYASTQKIARTPHFPVDVKGEGAHFQFAQDDDRQNGSLFLGGRRSLLGSVVSR